MALILTIPDEILETIKLPKKRLKKNFNPNPSITRDQEVKKVNKIAG